MNSDARNTRTEMCVFLFERPLEEMRAMPTVQPSIPLSTSTFFGGRSIANVESELHKL